ncbi:hypothetical protein E2I00_017069, partial [Balaenoptera physalus]
QNGSLHQKDTVHDNDFEPYLSGQSNQRAWGSSARGFLLLHGGSGGLGGAQREHSVTGTGCLWLRLGAGGVLQMRAVLVCEGGRVDVDPALPREAEPPPVTWDTSHPLPARAAGPLTGRQSNSYPSMADPYLSSYYPPSIGFPYSLNEAPWSTGGDPPIPYLTTYGQLSNGDHHFMHDAGQQAQSSAYGNSYTYPPSSLGGTIVDGQTGFHSDTLNKAPGMNSLEQGMVGLKIGDVTTSAVKTVGSTAFGQSGGTSGDSNSPGSAQPSAALSPESHPVLEKLKAAHSYNPREFDWNLKSGRVFIIKSYSEDDVHRSIKYSLWCSTEHGNRRLDSAFRALGSKGPVYLLFSVNGSGHFCGVAEMKSPVDYGTSAGVWSQDKWKGKFDVKWIFVKDVPNSQLRHIRLENNDNKPVTNSRDTQEVPLEKAKQVLRIIASYKHTTSIFDDFSHYEKRQEEEEVVRKERQNRNKQ